MPQSLARVLVHIVDSTKDRRPRLQTEKIRNDLYKYKATVLRDKVDSPALIIGGVEDHIPCSVPLVTEVGHHGPYERYVWD